MFSKFKFFLSLLFAAILSIGLNYSLCSAKQESDYNIKKFIILPDETIQYPVEGGNIYFDTKTGSIYDADRYITKAILPDRINGVSIKSISYSAFYLCENMEEIVLPDNEENIKIKKGSFAKCGSLKKITIPKNVTLIEDSVFSECYKLENIFVDDDNPYYCDIDGVLFDKKITSLIAFPRNKNYESYSIPKSVKKISEMAFRSSSLKEIIIPNGVTSIEELAFYTCTRLKKIEIPDTVTNIGRSAFQDCVSLEVAWIPDSVINIGEGGFKNCSSLINLRISNNITEIKYNCFENIGLDKFLIPDNVKSIGDNAFLKCSRLKKVKLPNNFVNISDSAFSNCINIREVIIPEKLNEFSIKTFDDCIELRKFDVDKNNEFYCSEDEILFNKDKTVIIKFPPKKYNFSYTIPDGVLEIGEHAFFNCSNLQEIYIPDSVVKIRNYSFEKCSNLQEIVIPESVKSIDEFALILTWLHNKRKNTYNPVFTQAVIYCKSNSAAHKYAEKNYINYILT